MVWIPRSIEITTSRTPVEHSTAEVQTLGLGPNTAPHSCPFSWKSGILIDKSSQVTSQPIPGQASESTVSYHPQPLCLSERTSQHFSHQMLCPAESGTRDLSLASPAKSPDIKAGQGGGGGANRLLQWFELSRTRLYRLTNFSSLEGKT